jgi:hypothetical protein
MRHASGLTSIIVCVQAVMRCRLRCCETSRPKEEGAFSQSVVRAAPHKQLTPRPPPSTTKIWLCFKRPDSIQPNMADIGNQLSAELTRITDCPYPASLAVSAPGAFPRRPSLSCSSTLHSQAHDSLHMETAFADARTRSTWSTYSHVPMF